MKKTITLLTILMLTAFAVSKAEASKLILRTNTFKATAFIAGQTFFSHHGEFNVQHLPPGRHMISITESRRRRGKGRDFGKREFNHHNQGQLVFRGRIYIPQNSIVYARVTPRGRLVIDEIRRIPRRRSTHRRPPARQPQYRNNDFRNNQYRDHRYPNDVNQDRRRGSNFNDALNMINRASFESEKLSLAKQYIQSNNISSNEVLLLMNTMDFETSKLEVAKLGYDYTIDPENYFIVNKGFGFSSSINALN
ncbi:MAG: DUF4476 domain-containing protein, partial [Bacteroidia bacterium]|nr:DUF4476 domain-containing protein [Bacteroidia bacterium]